MSPEEEIKKLEQQLEQKKSELVKTEATPQEEKEMLREVLKEHIETLRPTAPSVSPPVIPPVIPPPVAPTPADTQARIKQGEADEATVRLLVEKAMTGTIEDAVREAEKISPYMVDELHDHLVDDMYDKLVSLRKIKKF